MFWDRDGKKIAVLEVKQQTVIDNQEEMKKHFSSTLDDVALSVVKTNEALVAHMEHENSRWSKILFAIGLLAGSTIVSHPEIITLVKALI